MTMCGKVCAGERRTPFGKHNPDRTTSGSAPADSAKGCPEMRRRSALLVVRQALQASQRPRITDFGPARTLPLLGAYVRDCQAWP